MGARAKFNLRKRAWGLLQNQQKPIVVFVGREAMTLSPLQADFQRTAE
jgi:hypothetical protein